MYRNSYQRGMITVFYSCGSKPLAGWDVVTRNGYVSRFIDPDIKSTVFEIGGSNVSTTYMIYPKGNIFLGITMPFLVMIVKNLRKYFSFEVTARDETGQKRRFRVSNFQSTTQIMPLSTVMPIGLTEGWNQIQFNMAEFMRRAYHTQYIEVLKLKINANIRIRRVYFAERLVPEDQLPPEFRLFFPLVSKRNKDKMIEDKDNKRKENIEPTSSIQNVEVLAEKVNDENVITSAPPAQLKKSNANISKIKSSHSKISKLTKSEASVIEKKLDEPSERPPSEVALEGAAADLTEAAIEDPAEGLAEAGVESASKAAVESSAKATVDSTGDAGETLDDIVTDILIDEPQDNFDDVDILAPDEGDTEDVQADTEISVTNVKTPA